MIERICMNCTYYNDRRQECSLVDSYMGKDMSCEDWEGDII